MRGKGLGVGVGEGEGPGCGCGGGTGSDAVGAAVFASTGKERVYVITETPCSCCSFPVPSVSLVWWYSVPPLAS